MGRRCGLKALWRAALFLLIVSVLPALVPGQVQAEENTKEEASFRYEDVEEAAEEPDASLLEELDFSEVQQTVDEILGGDFQFENTVLDLITGKQAFTLESFLEALIAQAGNNWETEKQILLSYSIQGTYYAYLSNPDADTDTFVRTIENIVRCLKPLL